MPFPVSRTHRRFSRRRSFAALVVAAVTGLVAACLAGGPALARDVNANLLIFDDPSGQLSTFSAGGVIDLDNPFFQELGTNGRRCVTCHQPGNGWGVSAASVQARFAASRGTDPIFRSNDGSNCEGAAPASLADRRAAYSLLLERGVIRIGLDIPAGAEFTIDRIDDPLHCAGASNDVSLYRRPLPAANLNFLSAVMWDSRESSANTTIQQDLAQQARDATLGHEQASVPPSDDEIRRMVAFESGLFVAQARDTHAGALDTHGAKGGSVALSRQPFFIGINDPVALDPTGAPFDPDVFTIFDGWRALHSGPLANARLAIARGQEIFDTRTFTISGVAGLNSETFASGVSVPASFAGTCSTCHDSPNSGSHSVKAPLDIGVAAPDVAPYLPVYTLRNLATNATIETTDPGRAMITGKWADVGKFKGPVLRGLAARAPYFHNGAAATLDDVVKFYDSRFAIGLTPEERADLAAFLRAL